MVRKIARTRSVRQPEILIERIYVRVWIQTKPEFCARFDLESKPPFELWAYETERGWTGYLASEDPATALETTYPKGCWELADPQSESV